MPLDDEHELATIGYSTPTPWETPRERTEEEIGELIEKLMPSVADPAKTVFNFHCPPLDSRLDTCLKLDASVWPPTPVIETWSARVLRSRSTGGGRRAHQSISPRWGSTATSTSRGGRRSTAARPAFNPGSEYGEGVLRGLIVAIRGGEVVGHQFTSG